jgi:hypothetical protein
MKPEGFLKEFASRDLSGFTLSVIRPDQIGRRSSLP